MDRKQTISRRTTNSRKWRYIGRVLSCHRQIRECGVPLRGTSALIIYAGLVYHFGDDKLQSVFSDKLVIMVAILSGWPPDPWGIEPSL